MSITTTSRSSIPTQEEFKLTSGQPKTYRSSSQATRQFCADCGTQLLFFYDASPEEVHISVASLDDSYLTSIKPGAHIYTASMLSFISAGDLPMHAGDRM